MTQQQPIFDFEKSEVPQLKALENSYTNNDLEAGIKDLFIELFKSNLGEDAFNTFVLGVQHLGSYSLVQKSLNADGLALINSDLVEKATRYLYRAWKSGDVQKRGLHIVRIYLRLLFGEGAEVSQLQQPIDEPYPCLERLEKFDPQEGIKEGYFLTSRVNLDIDISMSGQPIKQVTNSFQSVLPARFVPDIRFSNITTTFDLTFICVNWGLFDFHFLGEGYLIQKYFNNPDQSGTTYIFVDDYERAVHLDGEGELSLDKTKSVSSQSQLNTAGTLKVRGYWKATGFINANDKK